MKNYFLSIVVLATFASSVTAQTAVNFNCNDCSGNNHDLFAELDAGKVIVIDWVMPCGSCIGPSLTASNIVQSYSGSNLGQVFLYVVDDYANTNCTSLGSWCNSNGIVATTFSNASINMLDYNATSGMPKIVVLGGGTSHTVYFDEINTAAGNVVALQAAIDSALATSSRDEPDEPVSQLQLYPNPVIDYVMVEFYTDVAGPMSVQLCNELGQLVAPALMILVHPGMNIREIYVGDLAQGLYYISLGDTRTTLRFAIVY